MANVKANAPAGVTPQIMVSFGPTYLNETNLSCFLPTAPQYRQAVEGFIQEFSQQGVLLYSAWNEPNDAAQPTSWNKNPTGYLGRQPGPIQAGRYWLALQQVCTGACKPAAGEFADHKNLFMKSSSGKREPFWTAYMKGLAGAPAEPRYWAFHPYTTGETGNLTRLKTLAIRMQARNSQAELWLSEIGARWHVVAGIGHTDHFIEGVGQYQDPRADDYTKIIMNFLVNDVVNVSNRITMFLGYQMISCQWNTTIGCQDRGPSSERWDSAMLRYTVDGWIPRSQWHIYKSKINPY